MNDFSWYPRQTYLFHGQEVIRVDADIHSYFMGTVYDYKVTYFNGRVKRGQAQRNDFSGFLRSHNMLPAWAEQLEQEKGPVEFAEQWGFARVPACQRPCLRTRYDAQGVRQGIADEGVEHVCYVPKEALDPTAEIQGPQAGVKVFSLQISFAPDRTCGSPVVMTATGMNGAAFEVPYHSLKSSVGSVARAIERQLSLPEWLHVKLVTLSGEPLPEADMLFGALDVQRLRAGGFVRCCVESPETVAQAESFIASMYQRIHKRDDLSQSLKLELLPIALAEARHNDPEVEQFLHMLAAEVASALIHEGVSRGLAEMQAYIDNLQFTERRAGSRQFTKTRETATLREELEPLLP